MAETNQLTDLVKQASDEALELREKEYELRKHRVEYQHVELQERLAQKKAFKNLPIGQNIGERAKSLIKENREYIEYAKKATVFLDLEVFKDKVALFPRNIILIGAQTGTGKSTTGANFILSHVMKKKKVLVITNEEYPTDILNRVICLIHGWAYTNHDEVTPEMQSEFDRLYPLLMQKIEIIHDMFNGVGGTTTTLEGIQSIYDTLYQQYKSGEKPYDAIIIDYIQNIKSSLNYPNIPQWQVLDKFGALSDAWKGLYPAPIILLSQLKEKSSDGDDNFKDRIEKFKAVMNHATTAIEVVADRENLRSEWIFRKSRFKDCVNSRAFTGYNKGKYVEYTSEFARKVELKNTEKKHRDLMGKVFKNKEEI